jgi:hypothetical protein
MYYDCQWDAPAWMTRPGWLTRGLIVKVMSVVLAGALAAASFFAWTVTRPEPFRVAHAEVTYGGIMVKKDGRFHVGVADIEPAGRDVTVLEVTPLMSDTVEFLGAVTVYGRGIKKTNVGAGTSFPPSYVATSHPIGEVIPFAETTYVPRGWDAPAPVEVAAGFRLRPGATAGAVNGIRIVYKVGNKKHTEIKRYAAVACSNGCPQMKADRDFPEHYLQQSGMVPAED